MPALRAELVPRARKGALVAVHLSVAWRVASADRGGVGCGSLDPAALPETSGFAGVNHVLHKGFVCRVTFERGRLAAPPSNENIWRC
jgi:hypothetical protein